MSDNENQEPGIVRADYLQRFTARQRMQARTNIRAAKLPDITQALVYGLDLLALTPLSPPAGMLSDDGGAVLVLKTVGGNWSSDGNETAPLVGPWLYLIKTTATETVDGETDESDTVFPSVTQNITHWDIEYWEDGAQDTGFAWQSEKLHADLAEDLFMFRVWRPVPDDEETQSTVWIQPVESALGIPDISGLQAALDERLQFVGEAPITDASMTALGFTDQLQVTDGVSTWYLPVSSTPWY